MMKKIAISCLMLAMMVGCQESLEDRAARETEEYTQKYCPVKVSDNTFLDSMTFDKQTHTLVNHFSIMTDSTSAQRAVEKADMIKSQLIEDVRNDTRNKRFKEEGYSFRFVARSYEDQSVILYDNIIRPEDYQ